MKKIISTLLLCILAFGCVMALASCAPHKDSDKAIEKLEDKDYTVTTTDAAKCAELTESIKASIATLPTDKEGMELRSKLENQLKYYDGIELLVYATNEDTQKNERNYVYIYYYEDKDAAEKAFEAMESELEAEAENVKGTDNEFKFGVKKNYVYVGTKAAIKAAR